MDISPSAMLVTSGSELLSSTVSGVAKFTKLVTGNSITGVRENTDTLKKRIVMMQQRLDDLRLCESNLKNRLYASVDRAELELRYGADGKQTINPKQSLEAIRKDSNPDHNFLFSKNKLRDSVPGFKEIETEINSIETEIKDIDRRIGTYQDMIKDQEELANKNKETVYTDIEKDRTTKTILSYLYFLRNLSMGFKKITTGASKDATNGTTIPSESLALGARGYSTASKDEKKRMQMRETFKAYIRSIGKFDPQYINGPKEMNLSDIGDDKNLEILNNDIDSIKFICSGSSAKNIKELENTITKFTDNLTATINDPNRSKNMNSVEYYTPEKGDILARTTTNMATMMANAGKNSGFWTSWNKTNELGAVLATFLGYTNKSLGQLEPCPESKVDDPEADAKADAMNQQKEASTDAAKQVQDEQAKAESEAKAKEKQAIITEHVMELAIAKYKEVGEYDVYSTDVNKLETMKARLRDAINVLLELIIGREGLVPPTEKREIENMKDTLKDMLKDVTENLNIKAGT